jgi:hypothetical protein
MQKSLETPGGGGGHTGGALGVATDELEAAPVALGAAGGRDEAVGAAALEAGADFSLAGASTSTALRQPASVASTRSHFEGLTRASSSEVHVGGNEGAGGRLSQATQSLQLALAPARIYEGPETEALGGAVTPT